MRDPLRLLSVSLCALLASAAVADEQAPDFAKNGRPFLEQHCLACHSGDEPEAGLSLEAFGDSAALVPARKTWETAVKMIMAAEMPPPGEPRPTVAEAEAFVEHVQAVFEHHDRHAEPDPGRVTMRRLNRVEYQNTIRDLVGVDFDPTASFPSDEIGHGFDNIGDVLTVSPVLMERYIAAAESIMSRAILPDPPAPPKRHLSARYSEPASGDVAETVIEDGWRRLASDAEQGIETGPIHTPYQWEADGEYIFRTRVYARSEGKHPVRVAVLVHGEDLPDPTPDEQLASLVGDVMRPAKILETVDVTTTKAEEAQTLEVRVPAMPGRHRMLVALVAPPQDQPPAQLLVEHLALEGPLDTRPASHRRLLACSPDKPEPEQTREVLARFLRRAYRRPPTDEELERLLELAAAVRADGESWESAMQLAMQAVLCSPKFLFRVELDESPTSPEVRSLDEFQLASRLSYFLWSTMPDDQLLELAAQGELTANLPAQVRRMLSDPRSQELVENFALQWLQLKRLEQTAPDVELFPQFDERLRAAMQTETMMFFGSIMREDRSILELLDADYTFLNEPLARHYGIVDTAGNAVGEEPKRPGGEPIQGAEFTRVSLAGGPRGGLLTQASVLTVTSNPTRTSPVKRGRWVLEQILGAPPPPPPPDVPELPEDEHASAGGSLRERLEIHRQNPSCANCHAKMDPIGFALENFDAVGAFRTRDGEFPIDASGEFADGTRFDGPAGLKQILKEKDEEFARCLTEKMLTYALGRGVEYYDRPSVEQIVAALADGEYRFSVLVTEIVTSDPFRLRRGK